MEWLGPAWLTVGRLALAAPLLACIAGRRLWPAVTLRVAVWGALGLGVVIIVQNVGIERTSVSHGALIVGAVPVIVAVITVATGRGTAGPLAWLGFALALVGVGLVASSGAGAASTGGDMLVLLSVALSAAMISQQPRMLEGRNPVAVTAVQFAAGGMVALPVAIAFEGLPPAPPSDGSALLAAVLVITAGTLVPFALFAFGQARIAPEVAGAFVNLEPLVGAVVGALAFGDVFGAAQLAGGVALLVGIAFSTLPRRQPAAPGNPSSLA